MKTLSFAPIRENNVIQWVDSIIQVGIENRSSDIHLRYNEDEIEVKYRVNGVLKEIDGLYAKIDKRNLKKSIVEIVSRIKIMAEMNVAEKRKPQDGSFSFLFMEEKYDIRVAMLPVLNGESVVIRILKVFLEDIELGTLGFGKEAQDLINKMIMKKYGIILISGPTGSGKSTTLNSIINMLNDGTKKIISVEDPVENKIFGLTQVQVNKEIGLTFAEVLKSTLRSDPDIIVISEIRDEVTAEIAVRAALTGHLVLGTIHTNDAMSTITRLHDMGVAKYLVLDSLVGLIGQRLVRRKDNEGRITINETLYCSKEIKAALKKGEKISAGSENYRDFDMDIREKTSKNLIDERDILGIL